MAPRNTRTENGGSRRPGAGQPRIECRRMSEREADLTLEPGGRKILDWVRQAMERIVPNLESLPDQPAGYSTVGPEAAVGQGGGDASPDLPFTGREVPEQGMPLEKLLDFLFGEAIRPTFNTAGPGYMAYIPGGGLFHAALADLIADSLNRFVGVWVAAPHLARIEAEVTEWLAELMGMPATTRGLLTTGGSISNLTAVITARMERLEENFLNGMIYSSDQAHHSVGKATTLAGFPERNLVSIPTDHQFRMDILRLREQVAADRAAGRRPFLVVAAAGTTNSGAVDDLEALADLCRDEEMWLHVDGAYGGFFRMTDRGRQVLSGIERADSITLDPHKGMFLPYGTGALLVRDGAALRRTHSTQAEYMPSLQEDRPGGPYDFCEYSMELSRGFRGLRLWLPIKMHGIGPFRNNLEEKLELTRWVTEQLRPIPGLAIVAEPQLSVMAFRLQREGLDEQALETLNRRFLARILARNRVWLTPTRLSGQFVIRICILSFRTHRDRVEECLEIIREEAAAILNEGGRTA